MLPPHGLSTSPSFALPGRGDLIAGRYRVEHRIGSGGMGVVVEAFDEQMGTRVAVKLLRPEGSAPSHDPQDESGILARSNRHREMSTRLIREASAAARLSSEHVTRVLDVGRLPHGDPYIVMELLEGVDLGRYVKDRGPLPIAEAVHLVLQACDAIVEAHALGIVHRDLKPGNLFLTSRRDGSPFVKVLDFGISKVLGADDNQLTGTSDMLGSPLYMAPEQIRNARDVDARADVWSLGTILYRLLAGRAAFEAQGSAATLAAIIGDAPEPLRAARPDVPPDLEAVILRCLEKDPARRIQSARELAIALTRFAFAPAGPLVAVPQPATVTGTSPQAVVSVPPSAVTVSGPRRPPLAQLALGIFLGSALFVGGVVAWRFTAASPSKDAGGAQPAANPSIAPSAATATPSGAAATPGPSAAPTATPSATAETPPSATATAAPSAGATAAPSAAATASTSRPVRPLPRTQGAPADDPLGDRL